MLLLPLFRRRALVTTGTALQKSFEDLDIPRFRHALPRCTGLFMIGLVENVPSTEFEFNVAFFSGFDRDHQPATPLDIAASAINSSNTQGVRSADYTNVQNFLLDSRLQLWWRNPAGISGVKTGVASAILGQYLST